MKKTKFHYFYKCWGAGGGANAPPDLPPKGSPWDYWTRYPLAFNIFTRFPVKYLNHFFHEINQAMSNFAIITDFDEIFRKYFI